MSNVNEEVLGALGALEGLVPQTVIAGLEKQVVPPANQPPANNPPAEPSQSGQQAPPAATTPEQNKGGEPAGQQAQEPGAKPSIFGKKNQAPISIENENQLIEAVNKNFGMDLKSLSEVSKFIESSQKWRKESQKATEVENKYKELETALVNAPKELFAAFSAYAKGEDWKSAIGATQNSIDFSKPASAYKPEDLVKHYFKDKFTEEDFSASPEDQSDAFKIAMDAAITKFEAQKQSYDNQVLSKKQMAEQAIAAYKSSVESSLKLVKSDFPDMDDNIFNDVQSVMNGGQQAILSLFLNQDGTVKPEAARAILLAKYNDDVLGTIATTAAHVAESTLNEEILTRGADAPKPVRTAGAPQEVPEEVKKLLDELKTIGSQNRTF